MHVDSAKISLEVHSIYPNALLRRSRFRDLAQYNRTLWLGLSVYLIWRTLVRLRAPRRLQLVWRRIFIAVCAMTFVSRMRRCDSTEIVAAAGYLGPAINHLRAIGHRICVNHGSLYERKVRSFLQDEGGVDEKSDTSNWVNEWLVDAMDVEFANADRIILCSPTARETMPERWHKKCYVVPLGAPDWTIKISRSGKKSRTCNGMRYLHVSSLVPQKNVGRILDAYALVRRPGDVLVVCGPSPADPQLRRRLESEPGVEYLGRLTRQALEVQYSTADMFVHPSLSDGWGLVVTEALSANLVVISSAQTGAADFYHRAWKGTEQEPFIRLSDPLSFRNIANVWLASREVCQQVRLGPRCNPISWKTSAKCLIEVAAIA